MAGLTWTEWAGVTVVGLALGYAGRAIANAQEDAQTHQTAMLLTGAGLYIVGVGIGAAGQQPGGWASGGEGQKFIPGY